MQVRRISDTSLTPAITPADEFIFVDTSADDVTMPLFPAKGFDGKQITIYKISGDNTGSLLPEDGTVDGQANYDLTAAGSLYISMLDNAGKLFQKQNDVGG